MIDRREYREEITKEEAQQAKKLGFVVIFGYSDDGAVIKGAINEHVGAWDGVTLTFDKDGLITNDCEDDNCPYHAKRLEEGSDVELSWHDEDNPCWTFETDIPHAKFNIMEDDELYGEGIVFDMAKQSKCSPVLVAEVRKSNLPYYGCSHHCGYCGYPLNSDDNHIYCPSCGRKLEWS